MVGCPSEDELSGLVTGNLPPMEIERVATHLESCAACEARVSALDQLSDRLMSGLRARGGVEAPGGELKAGRVLGDYVLGEELGAGGMGRVFRATHARMRREVALKVVSRRGMRSADAARRFAREVEVAAKLVHPNIAIAHDAREEEGVVYLILEYVDGTDLARLVKEKGPLGVPQAVDYVIQAARGLAYAHGRGVVHRDVKPANLMLDGDGVVKVLDMGLSRLREQADLPATSSDAAGPPSSPQMTQAGDVLGTVDFVAPEQAQSARDADHRADVYGLGCTLFYLLTGRGAFARGSTPATLAAHRDEAAPSLRAARPGVSARLAGVFERMVAKRPEDRFATMKDVIDALRACQAEEGLRRRRIVAAVAVCLIALTIGGGLWRNAHARPSNLAAGPATTMPTTQVHLPQPPMPVSPFAPDEAVRHRDRWAAYASVPVTLTNTLGMKFTFIPPGQFVSIHGVTERQTRPYYLGVTEVTVGQMRAFTRESGYRTMAEQYGGVVDAPTGFRVVPGVTWDNPAFPQTEDHPALQLAWVDLVAMAEWLSKKENRAYRVPTASQWSWAGEAGTEGQAVWGGGDADDYGWTTHNSGRVSHPVATRKANPWGLYDLRGNAAEWCSDLRDNEPVPTYPPGTVIEDPIGPSFGRLRELLGSTFDNDAPYLARGVATPTGRYPTWGGRLLLEIDGAPRVVVTTRPVAQP